MGLSGKRIVFFTRRFGGGGAERMTVLLANNFAARGLDVSVIAIDGKDDAYPLDERVKATCLNPGGGNITGKIRRLAGIERYLNKICPDVVIDLGSSWRYISLLRIYERSQLVLSERNYPPVFYSEADFAKIGTLYAHADKVVFQTPDARDCFSVDVKSKSWIIANAVTQGLPSWREGTQRRIVAVGRLEPQKDYDLLLNAFVKFLKGTIEPYELCIYGQGSLVDHLRSRACELGIADHVNFLSFCSDVHERIADACMYVTSSDFEGLQNSLMEAMAMGIPCVATDCLGGGARLITDGGRRGLLVPRGDADALAEAMADVAASAELRERLSAAGREIAELYSVDSICDQWIRYIEGD